ncbi:MAG: 4-(cytidine 5-diphospho)-2-C-methyl-D-erythritol kinase [Haloplasmataceae bacterium]|jgi:4-diphosphocytidyl-2-C-methyl-D-erythritol kinase|nr:4-(cytidine 5-diphospho)-2-C-methyl-D-erythritol kinase [Haloplasmataceae bacterium]
MIIEKAPAKINLALNVINKREDNYHNLHMVMTTIDLFDRLTFEKIDEDKIVLSSNKHYLPNDERNLVYKVTKLIKEKYKINSGVRIFIQKHIPVAAGLAGGSSDAAATIRALNKMFKLNLSLSEMIEIGQSIGSDVPFCLYNKTAIAEGRGEILTPLQRVPRCWVILVKPIFGVSTKEIFENIKINEIEHPNVQDVISAVKEQNYLKLCQSIGNSLEQVTFRLYPEVKEIKDKLLNLGVDAVLMSGSGPTVFALTRKENKAMNIINSLDHRKYELFAIRTLG